MVCTAVVHNTKVTYVHSQTTAGSLFERSESSSIQLTGTGQKLEIEMTTGEETTFGYSNRTHVHQLTKTPLGSWFTGLNMDCTNPKTGYENSVVTLPFQFSAGKPLQNGTVTDDHYRRKEQKNEFRQSKKMGPGIRWGSARDSGGVHFHDRSPEEDIAHGGQLGGNGSMAVHCACDNIYNCGGSL